MRRPFSNAAHRIMSEENGYVNDVETSDAEPTIDPVGADGVAADVAPSASDRQLADERDRYLRLAAEYDNFRKRTTRERQDAHLRGQGDMLKGMIDALDDLARFAHVDPASTDAKTVVDGVAMVEKKLMKTLAGHGLEVIDPVDHPFDPARHEAVMTEPAATPEEDHVVARVFQQGYLFNGQLLRPARVVVKQWNG
ncbi:MAG: nucleotide exchange factor GrpE [Gemmatimonadaceae bacterium]|nr:nucleotide exchange factor GrpE [Gemmatimonadaceae bacterium]